MTEFNIASPVLAFVEFGRCDFDTSSSTGQHDDPAIGVWYVRTRLTTKHQVGRSGRDTEFVGIVPHARDGTVRLADEGDQLVGTFVARIAIAALVGMSAWHGAAIELDRPL